AAHGHRQGDNPASWARLKHLLPQRKKVHEQRHHAALPYAEMPAFMDELRERPEAEARALGLLVLTATRTNEVLKAQWSEFDIKNRVWTIPKERAKTRRQHRIPLSDSALAAIGRIEPTPGRFLFNLGPQRMLILLANMRDGLTVHGF